MHENSLIALIYSASQQLSDRMNKLSSQFKQQKSSTPVLGKNIRKTHRWLKQMTKVSFVYLILVSSTMNKNSDTDTEYADCFRALFYKKQYCILSLDEIPID